jgi:hypothetical protein
MKELKAAEFSQPYPSLGLDDSRRPPLNFNEGLLNSFLSVENDNWCSQPEH